MGVIPLLDERSGPFATASTSSGLIPRTLREISASGPGSGILPRYLQLLVRADEKTEEECHPQPNVNLCEKPTASSRIDVIVPVCIA